MITACYESKTISTDELALTNTSDADISLKQSESPHELVSTTKPSWVWFSTPDSFATSKVSILAIIETIMASMIYLLIAFKYGTAHLTIAVLLAPILLLRTDESVKYALEHSRGYEKTAFKYIITPTMIKQIKIAFESVALLSIIIFFILGVLGIFDNLIPGASLTIARYSKGGTTNIVFISVFAGLFVGGYIYTKGIAIRLYATIRCTLISPYKALSSIPKNWWNQIICLDTLHPPEVIPGVIKFESEKNIVSRLQPFCHLYVESILKLEYLPFYHIFITPILKSPKKPIDYLGFHTIGRPFYNAIIFLTTTLLTYFYRWSIKGTAILMLPMIGLLYDSKTTKPENIKNSLVMNTLFHVSCFMLLYAILILILRTFEINLGFNESIQKFLWLNDPHGIIKRVFPENKIMLWQLFLILTALLTFCCHLYADRLINRGYSNNRLWWFRQLLSTIGLSAVCLIFSLIYLSASIAHFG